MKGIGRPEPIPPARAQQTRCSTQNMSYQTTPYPREDPTQPHKNNTKTTATAKPAHPAGANSAAPPAKGADLLVVSGNPELGATTPVPATVPFK